MKEFLKELIRAESTPAKGELAAAKVVASRLAASGIRPVVDNWQGKRANVSARVEGTGEGPALLFVCHLDVVPAEGQWTHAPFEGVEHDGRIYGRGAVDMKGGIVAVVTAICELVESGVPLAGDIVFAATAGEETDSVGAERFLSNAALLPSRLAGVILPEPTDFSVVTAHRGMVWFRITTKGKAAHSSTPQLGVNAIYSMNAVLNQLVAFEVDAPAHPLLGACSKSINTIRGGEAPNMVPTTCTIGLDIRTLPGQDHGAVVADVENLLKKLAEQDPQFEAELNVVRQVQSLETDGGCAFVRRFCETVGAAGPEAVGYTTDGPHFAHLGAPIVVYGPGKGQLCHKPDEHLAVSDLEQAARRYKEVIATVGAS